MSVKLKQIGTREGERGNVYDTYELLVYDEPILSIRHYVEFSPDEVPLAVTVPKRDRINLSYLD